MKTRRLGGNETTYRRRISPPAAGYPVARLYVSLYAGVRPLCVSSCSPSSARLMLLLIHQRHRMSRSRSLPHGPHLVCPGCMYVACIHFCVIRNVLVTNHSRGARARERAPVVVQTIFSAAGRRRLDRRPLIFPVGRGLTRGWPVPRTKLVTPSAAPQQPAFSLHADSTLARTEAARAAPGVQGRGGADVEPLRRALAQ